MDQKEFPQASEETANRRSTVYYDGACPMCSAFSAAIQDSSIGRDMDLLDFRTTRLPESISKEKAEGALQLVQSNGKVLSGAEAVLAILAKNDFGRILKAILLFPLVRPLTHFGYSWVARNRFHIFGMRRTLFLTKIIVLIASLFGILMTHRAWRGEESRSFPMSPLFDFLITPAAPFDLILLGLPLGLILWNLYSPKWQHLFWFAAGTFFVSCFDQNRWMPFIYQFVLISLVLALSGLKSGPPNDEERNAVKRTEAAIALLLASIWFWSGFLKFNWRFFQIGVGWLAAPTAAHLPESSQWMIYTLIILIPFAEALAASFLLFPLTRTSGALVLLGVHTGALLTLGPTGYVFNTSVWSWNISMMVFLVVYFSRENVLDFSSLFKSGAKRVLPIVIFPTLFPALNLVNLWPHYFSFSLYTWATAEGLILTTKPDDSGLPEDLRPLLRKTDTGDYSAEILDWSYRSLNSPPFPEPRIMRSTFEALCKRVHDPSALRLELTEVIDRVHPPAHVEEIRCDGLKRSTLPK